MKVEKQIEDAFEVLSQINEVKVSSSFKQRVLDKALTNKQENTAVYWFTPKLQLAAMIVVLLINSLAIIYSFSSSASDTTINSFAEEYNFTTTATSLIN